MVTIQKLPDWLRRLYPFAPKRHACGAVGMSYVDEGPRTPEAVLLLHGNPTWSFFYRDSIPRLVTAGRRCVAPDHIGMGLSAKPQDYPYRLETHIANLEGLVNELGLKRVDLVVHDWGGAIGFGWAARHPELVDRIVILNTAAFPAPQIPLRISACRVPWAGEWVMRGLNGFAWPATWMAVKRPLSAAVKRGYLFPYDSWANRVGVARFVQDIPMKGSHPSMAALEEMANALPRFADRPILIAWGGADFCFNDRFLERWRRIFPQAQVRYFPDAGHYVLEDAREELLPEITTFLGRDRAIGL
jgi:haloalkane dehalogenase